MTNCSSAAEERRPAPYTFISSPSLVTGTRGKGLVLHRYCRLFQFIPTQSKLHGEEVAGDELGDLLLAGPEGGEADLLSSVNMDKVAEAGLRDPPG